MTLHALDHLTRDYIVRPALSLDWTSHSFDVLFSFVLSATLDSLHLTPMFSPTRALKMTHARTFVAIWTIFLSVGSSYEGRTGYPRACTCSLIDNQKARVTHVVLLSYCIALRYGLQFRTMDTSHYPASERVTRWILTNHESCDTHCSLTW